MLDLKRKGHEIRPNGTKRVYSINEDVPRVQTQFQEQTDVNNIVSSYTKNPDLSIFRSNGVYMDATAVGDYQQSLDTIVNANMAFDSLPASIRERFKNDPAKLLAFMQDPDNYDEGVSLGLVKPDPTKNQQTKNEKRDQREQQNQNDKNIKDQKAQPEAKTKTQATDTE